MRIIHTGDLHIGKQINEFSMLEDQRYILEQIADICREKEADVIILAGDIYDRAMPNADAVEVLDEFLTKIAALGIKVMMISGNHDSAQRLGFGGKIFEKQGIHIQSSQDGKIKKVMLTDEFGSVCFYLLPFVKAGIVGADTMDQAVKMMLTNNESPDLSVRNVLVTHYFVANAGKEPELSDSESGIYVGGLDLVEASRFQDYDYVALGHIHKPQRLGESNIYYAGSPLKYSFSEANQTKSVRFVEFGKKGEMTVEEISLVPRREMRCIRGKISELVKEEILSLANREDYMQVTLTDTEETVDALSVIRSVYPNTMQLCMQKSGENAEAYEEALDVTNKRDDILFREFYELVTGKELSEEKEKVVKETFLQIREELA